MYDSAMAETVFDIPGYKSFNEYVAENLEAFISLCTYDLEFDLLDTVNYPEFSEYIYQDIELYSLVAEWMCRVNNVSDQLARQTVYRSLHFAKFTLECIGQYDHTLALGEYAHELTKRGDVSVAMLHDVNTYFEKCEHTRGLLNAFADELDVTGEGKHFDLVAMTLGIMWHLGEESMYETYVDIATEQLRNQ